MDVSTRLRQILPPCALALLVAGGCGEPAVRDARTLTELRGRVLHDAPFLVLPSRAWRQGPEGRWFFGRSAAMICRIEETPPSPLVFGFLLGDAGRRPQLEIRWNGRDVTTLAAWQPTGELQVPIPHEWLLPGTHFLTLRQPGEGERFLDFREIGYRYRDKPHPLPIRKYQSYRYLSNLLAFGVTGSFRREVLDGFVAVGERRIVVDLGNGGGVFQSRIQNSTEAPATFRVGWDGARHEVRLQAHERRQLRLAVPPGRRFLELYAEGDPNGFFLWGAPHLQPLGSHRPPPVVLVTLDTTRRDVLGTYGGDGAATPHLDAFASRATVYENAYTTAPWTLPAHASIFTGLYPSRHGAGVTGDHLEPGFDTLAEILRRHGYLTAGFAGGILSSWRFGVGQGFASYLDADGFERPADRLTGAALDFLRRAIVAPPAGESAPFFLFVNYFDPHFPFRAPAPFAHAFGVPELKQAVDGDLWRETLDGSAAAWERVVDGEAPAAAAALAALRAAYLAEVAFMDQQVGRLFTELRRWGLWDDALVVVTADHGELLGEGGYFSHSARLDPALVEVPLIVKWPGQREGRRVADLASLVDLFPTVLETTGAPGPRGDGQTLAAPRFRWWKRRFVIAEEHAAEFHRLSPYMRVAGHLFAFYGRDLRQLSWEGGAACYRREEGGWRAAVCDGSRVAEHREWRRRLERGRFQPRVDRIGLSRAEREQLASLGYLR